MTGSHMWYNHVSRSVKVCSCQAVNGDDLSLAMTFGGDVLGSSCNYLQWSFTRLLWVSLSCFNTMEDMACREDIPGNITLVWRRGEVGQGLTSVSTTVFHVTAPSRRVDGVGERSSPGSRRVEL